MKKKIISFLLAASMLISLFPVAFAQENTDAAEVSEYNYVFTREAVDTENNPSLLNKDGRLLYSTMGNMALTHIKADSSEQWRPAGHHYITGSEVKTAANGGLYWKATRKPTGMLTSYAVELYVPVGGSYVPSIKMTKSKSSPIVDVYLVKEGTTSNGKTPGDFVFKSETGKTNAAINTFVGGTDESKRPEAYKLGRIDLYADEESENRFSFSQRTLDGESKYYLIFHTVGMNSKCTANNTLYEVSVSSFRLGAPELCELLLDYESSYILVDDADGMKLSVSGKMTDGKAADLSRAKVTFASSDVSVAEVDKNGIITPVSRGNAKITVRVVMGEVTLTKSLLITVSKKSVAASRELLCGEMTKNASGDYELSFDTTEAGYYDVVMVGEKTSNANKALFYIDGKYIGSFDAEKKEMQGRSIELSEGEHTLIMKNGSDVPVSGVFLMSTEELCGIEKAEIEIGSEKLAPGQTADCAVKIVQKNGAEYYAPIVSYDGSVEAEFVVNCKPEGVASVENGFLKALTEGEAVLSVSETFNGFDVSGELEISVDDVSFDRAELNVYENERYFVGDSKKLETSAFLSDGREVEERDLEIGEFTSSDESVVKIENGMLTVVGEGEATVSVSVMFNETEYIASVRVKTERVQPEAIEARTEADVLSLLSGEGSTLVVRGINNNGSEFDLTGATFTYENLTPDTISLSDDGLVRALCHGTGRVKVTANIAGEEFSCVAEVACGSAKTKPTIYTYEMRENALDNIKKYDWAKSLQKQAVAKADKWVANLDILYELMPGEGVPRSFAIATLDAPSLATEDTPAMLYHCPYDGTDIRNNYGSYAWGVDPLTRPWKIQCPDCKRLFPSNDFGSFYELGLNKANGVFSRETALARHRELFGDLTIEEPGTLGSEQWKAYYGYGNKNGYLYNSMYSDKDSTWMVDDGFGWSPRDGVPGSDEKVTTNPKWCPIAFFMHRVWRLSSFDNTYLYILNDLRNAYLYTGDAKYGRAGAILVDRVADLYPEFEHTKTSLSYPNSHGGNYSGKILGTIWECNLVEGFIKAYDAFYPMTGDSEVIGYLSKKAAEYGMSNPKTSAELIRENAENGILREVMQGLYNGKIAGNFGKLQYAGALAAVALDTYPESGEMFDWLCDSSEVIKKKVYDPIYPKQSRSSNVKNTGGELLSKYVNDVDRDGFGYEVAIGYNSSWASEVIDIAHLLARYDKETPVSLLDNPKYIKMFNTIIKETMGNGYSLQLGDGGSTAGKACENTATETLKAFSLLDKDDSNRIQLAKNYYYSVKGELDDIYVDIFTDNSSLPGEIREIIEEYGEYEFESENLTGFGLAILRRGEAVKTAGAAADVDYRGDLWMYYGRTNQSHAHRDMLAIGIDAYGFNFTPDLGYPEATSHDENRYQWVKNTLSHNTVVVDDDMQKGIYDGKPLHYDYTERVGVIDVSAPEAYSVTEEYRRTVVSVAASDEVSYTVDFFRIKGGSKHTYSFHTQSHNGFSSADLNFVPQLDENGKDGMYDSTGAYRKYTYAGIGETYIDEKGKEQPVLYGPDPDGSNTTSSYVTRYPRGYTWLTNVNLADNVSGGNFSINFKQTDFNKQAFDSAGLNFKFTALNDWTPSEVAITTGYAPRKEGNGNVTGLDYMFIHREGENLDTLYTSVLQPYRGDEYIESMESVELTANGEPVRGNKAKAVRVTLKNGRTDYIVYSTVENVLYSVSDTVGENIPVSFNFRGFVGVYSVNDKGENIYSYVNDGDIIGNVTGDACYTGKVVEFTTELTDENVITVKFDGDINAENLVNRYVYVQNDGAQNGVYRICGAAVNDKNGRYTDLMLGNTSVIRSYKDNSDFSAGFTYNIEAGNELKIPLSHTENFAPEFTPVSDNLTTSAGSSITVNVNAQSSNNETITYVGNVLPRGASLNSETGTVTWKPDASQVGKSGFMITARDESGRESSITFEITVYGSTTGDKNGKEETPSTGDSGGSAGGGGGGGTAPTDKSDTDDESLLLEEKVPSTGEADEVENKTDAPEASGETEKLRFTDLGNHAWAADAINELV
ncbi:MAG: Ig-like domain-containing protein, partial [Oscillospiraceae bacterium]|nr:Ig-like domain-containing protein [Oscillospiraceae bacterium]